VNLAKTFLRTLVSCVFFAALLVECDGQCAREEAAFGRVNGAHSNKRAHQIAGALVVVYVLQHL
jgi:hypothetical protein